jgi:hypothetical protein
MSKHFVKKCILIQNNKILGKSCKKGKKQTKLNI